MTINERQDIPTPNETTDNGAPETERNTSAERRKKVTGAVVLSYIKRSIFLCVGLVVMSYAIALSIKAELGTSPISSTPYVLNLVTGLSVGVTTIIFNTLLVLLQIAILRKKFRVYLLLQIPVCIVFGFLNDFALFCEDGIMLNAYWQKWLLCLAGIIILAFGVSMEVNAGLITLAGEGLVLAFCQVVPVRFGYMKVICDLGMVLTAVVISLIFFHNVQGVREGTLATAVFVGLIARQLNRFMKPFSRKLFASGKADDTADIQND